MCQLMAQNASDIEIWPEPLIIVGAYSQLDNLACVLVESEKLWSLVRRQFGKEIHRELVGRHDMLDSRIVRETGEDFEC